MWRMKKYSSGGKIVKKRNIGTRSREKRGSRTMAWKRVWRKLVKVIKIPGDEKTNVYKETENHG